MSVQNPAESSMSWHTLDEHGVRTTEEFCDSGDMEEDALPPSVRPIEDDQTRRQCAALTEQLQVQAADYARLQEKMDDLRHDLRNRVSSVIDWIPIAMDFGSGFLPLLGYGEANPSLCFAAHVIVPTVTAKIRKPTVEKVEQLAVQQQHVTDLSNDLCHGAPLALRMAPLCQSQGTQTRGTQT